MDRWIAAARLRDSPDIDEPDVICPADAVDGFDDVARSPDIDRSHLLMRQIVSQRRDKSADVQDDIAAMDALGDRGRIGKVPPDDFSKILALDRADNWMPPLRRPHENSQSQFVVCRCDPFHRLSAHIAGGASQKHRLATISHALSLARRRIRTVPCE